MIYIYKVTNNLNLFHLTGNESDLHRVKIRTFGRSVIIQFQIPTSKQIEIIVAYIVMIDEFDID